MSELKGLCNQIIQGISKLVVAPKPMQPIFQQVTPNWWKVNDNRQSSHRS
jgi:hypothetical protein